MNDSTRTGLPFPGSTSASLLERARARDPEAWSRLVDLYGPLVHAWCRRFGLPASDLADVFQEIFAAVAGHLGSFRPGPSGGSFRGWLLKITRNKVHDYFRRRQTRPLAVGGAAAEAFLEGVAEPDADTTAPSADEENDLLRRALDVVRGDFEEKTWQAFWQVVVESRPAADIAAELGLSVNAVYKARARLLARLRAELGGLID